MRKLMIGIVLILFSLGCYICTKKTSIEIDLSIGEQFITISPKSRYLTTKCQIELYGYLDCDVVVLLPNNTNVELEAGVVSYRQGFEWFDEIKQIRISPDSCSLPSKLKLSYAYSMGYWGAK